MASDWRTVRVFISSTFRDMHSERDYLVKRVFPALRERLLPYRIHLIDIDLRWGVTSEQVDNDQALDLCLQQIDECRPLFVGLLGERYGWVPDRYPDEAITKHGWIQYQTGKSITELEILHGVLREEKMRGRAFFCFRDPKFLGELVSGRQLQDCAEFPTEKEQLALSSSKARSQALGRRRKLDKLKDAIRLVVPPVQLYDGYPCRYQGQKLNWRIVQKKLSEADRTALHEIARDGIVDPHEYASLSDELRAFVDSQSVVCLDGLKSFGDRLAKQLWAAIRADYDLPELPPNVILSETDPLAEESDYHERFMDSRLRVYVGRQELQRGLTKFADGIYTVPCLLTGASGAGKSATLAKFVRTYEKSHPDVIVISHFVGASPRSTDLRHVLRRFCHILQNEFGFGDEVPQEFNSLSTLFHDFLKRVPDYRRVLFVIDALNQLDVTDNAHALNWLPRDWPAHVKLITSCIDDADRSETVLEVLQRWKTERFRVGPLTNEERIEIVERVPLLSAKTLDHKQIQLFLSNPATTNPLFLLVALEELRGFGSFEELDDRIQSFPQDGDTVTELFAQVLERLEVEFGEELVRSVFRLLASARRGLSEPELQAMIGADRQSENLFPVLCQARAYLQTRGELLDFFHRGLYKAVQSRYLAIESETLAAHGRLANYFHGLLNPKDAEPWSGGSVRALSELAHHQTQGHFWDDLETTLCDLRFIQAKCQASMHYELVRNYSDALEALPEVQGERVQDQQRQERLRQYDDDLISYAKAMGKGVELPEPPDSRIVQELMRQTEAVAPTIDRTGSRLVDARTVGDMPHGRFNNELSRASRFRAFANFVLEHSDALSSFPEESIIIARNHAMSGPVVRQAEELAENLSKPWLQRDHRLPTLPERPLCIRVLHGHTDFINAIAVTPDGKTAVSGAYDKTLRIWDVATGECIRILAGHTGGISGVAVTPDGKTAISAGNDETLRVWDVATGECLRLLVGHTKDYVEAVALTPDGKTAISGGSDGTLRVWDVATGECLNTFGGHNGWVKSVALTPDGKTAVSATDCSDNLRVWDLRSGECLHTLEVLGLGGVRSVSLTPSGIMAVCVVALCEYASYQIFDLATGKMLREFQGRTNRWCNKIAISLTHDGNSLVSVGENNPLCVWDVNSGTCLRVLEGFTAFAHAVSLTADGSVAISACLDKTLRVWNLATGGVHSMPEGQANIIEAVAITPDGKTALSACGDRSKQTPPFVDVWDVSTGECLRRLEGHTNFVKAVALTPDGKTAISGSWDETLRVWDIATGNCLHVFKGGVIEAVALTPCGKTAVSAGHHGRLHAWNFATGKCFSQLEGHKDLVLAVAHSVNGHVAVSGSADQTLRVWLVAFGMCAHVLEGHTGSVTAVALSLDGKIAVSGSLDSTVRVWNTRSGKCLSILRGHTGSVMSVALAPDGKTVCSTGLDKTLRIWDLSSCELLAVYALECSGRAIAVSAENQIVVGTNSGQVHFLTLRNRATSQRSSLTRQLVKWLKMASNFLWRSFSKSR